jgi:hypothetical protein
VAVALVIGTGVSASTRADEPPKPVPRDAACGPMPVAALGHFAPGEELDYDIDVLGANAARMELTALPPERGMQPIRTRIRTNTFFNKVRRVKAESKSYLDARNLHPNRYTEDAQEDDERHLADVDFHPRNQPPATVQVRFATNPQGPQSYVTVYDRYAHDALDVLGATYYLRSVDMKPGMSMCFDVFAMRHMWRVWGTVEGIEQVPSPLGPVDAFHIHGTAARLDDHNFQRDLHMWITADDKRIPVGALGGIDLGPVRATLTRVSRSDSPQAKQSHVQALQP